MNPLQSVFNTVVNHLRKQNAKSMCEDQPGEPTTCAYRGYNGYKCAVGCLIDSAHYDPYLEGNTINNWGVRNAVIACLPLAVRNDSVRLWDLLHDLQRTHDTYDVANWERRFAEIASDYKLELPPKESQ